MRRVTTGVFDVNYEMLESRDDYDWPPLEKYVGVQFDNEQRDEIVRLRNTFFGQVDIYSQSPPVNEVDEMRATLLRFTQDIRDFSIGITGNEEAERKFHAVCWRWGGDVRDAFDELSRSSSRLFYELIAEPDGYAKIEDYRGDGRTPALTKLLWRIRSTPEWTDKKVGEWLSVGVSSRSKRLQRLLAHLLEWHEIKEHDIKNAILAISKRPVG